MKKIALLLLMVPFFAGSLLSQDSACSLRVSLITCGPGEELYSAWGHTAIRITDRNSGSEIIYNYGTFDFSDEGFYVEFVRGRLWYFLSYSSPQQFFYEYQADGRSVTEQELLLTCQEKRNLATALQTNAQEENKFYRYDFVYDNCSTRPRDIIAANIDGRITFPGVIPQPLPSYRNLIHEYLDKGHHQWSKFGIDLLLGSRLDKKSSNLEAMFLPDYLMKAFDGATVNGKPIVSEKKELLPQRALAGRQRSLFTPVNVLTAFFLLIAGLSFFVRNRLVRFFEIFDIAYFLVVGLLGAFLVFMWLGTDHYWCARNYNLLWAIPTHAIIAFFVLKRKKWVRMYFFVSAAIYVLVAMFWIMIPQGMNYAVVPLILIAGIRSGYRSLKEENE